MTIADAERLSDYMARNLSDTLPEFVLPPLIKIADEFSEDKMVHTIRFQSDMPNSNIDMWLSLATFSNPEASAQAFSDLVWVRNE